MKKQRTTYKWMLVLMVSSQLLLTGFVSYWLISQYRQEKEKLHSELTMAYFQAHDQLIDTLLLHHLVAPSLHDSLRVRLDISESSNSKLSKDLGGADVFLKHISVDSGNHPEIFTFKMDEAPADSALFIKSPKEEMLVRSVKLFINQADQTFRSDPMVHAFFMQIDTLRFINQLRESFAGWGGRIHIEWIGKNLAGGEPSLANLMILRGVEPYEIPAIGVSRYRGYLLQSILPQILFGLILLTLSASALFISYRSLKKQLSLNKLRDDFIGNISHELKTPVTTVKVALEALQTFDLKNNPKVSADYLKMASVEVDRLENLVGKVLQNQELEDPAIRLQKEPCNLQEVVSKVIRTLDFPIHERQAKIGVEFPDLPCTVMADPVYLEGVIINLIDNSLKYSGPHPEIRVEIRCEQSSAKVLVTDWGPGIPDEYKSQVFDKFFRIPQGERHDVKGHGLGLSFASQVMNLHGGSISFRNLHDQGCEFILTFPK